VKTRRFFALLGVNFPPFHRGCRCTVGTVSGIVFTGVDPRPTPTPIPTPEPVATPEPTNAPEVVWALANAKVEGFWTIEENRLAFEDIMQGVVDGTVSVEAGDLAALYKAAKQSQLGRTLETLKDYTSGTWTTPGEMLREQRQHGLSEEEINAIDVCWREIEDGRITEAWYKDGRTSAANKLARILYGEQRDALFDQVEVFYVIVTRLFHAGSFKEVGGKTLHNVITAPGQFTTYDFDNARTRDRVIAAKGDTDLWKNAKLLASYATLLFGNKTRRELIEEYREATGDTEGTAEDARAYFVEKLGMLPDIMGLPIGVFHNEFTKFHGGGDGSSVQYSDGKSVKVNVFPERIDEEEQQ